MGISDKTRKILWGRSGNRCAVCKQSLVVEAQEQDGESIVGEECHIISPKENGPRYDSIYPIISLESYENLILLCRMHHKIVDDQKESFTTEILRKMKAKHEEWVKNKLSEELVRLKPPKFIRVEKNTPPFLNQICNGKQLLDLVTSSLSLSVGYDEPKSKSEAELVGESLQIVKDWGDIGSDLGFDRLLEGTPYLTQYLEELEDAGFIVFGGREMQLFEGGALTEPNDWPSSIIRVFRKDNDAIVSEVTDE